MHRYPNTFVADHVYIEQRQFKSYREVLRKQTAYTNNQFWQKHKNEYK